jgi:hypothetical protein
MFEQMLSATSGKIDNLTGILEYHAVFNTRTLFTPSPSIMEKTVHTVTARKCWLSSQVFNIGSMISILLGPLVVPLVLWFAGSIFAYAAVAHHPDERVRHYNKWAGYRYYAYMGTLPTALIFAGTIQDVLHIKPLVMWIGVWVVGLLALIPWGVYDLVKSRREDWRDITVEIENHA